MAASAGTTSTGRKIYYNISYGMLCTNVKEAPEGYEEIALADIKSRRTKNENVDLRKRYYDTKNGKDYPIRAFYTDITGTITSVIKDKYDKGTSLKVTLLDSDGDESIIQTDFYGKVCADFLNRLLNVQVGTQLNFRPYSIPTSADINGDVIAFYNSGVSIKDNGVKTERGFKGKDSGLPASEQVVNSKGEKETSRVNQVNFLWQKVEAKFGAVAAPVSTETNTPPANTAANTGTNTGTQAKDMPGAKPQNYDDLPF